MRLNAERQRHTGTSLIGQSQLVLLDSFSVVNSLGSTRIKSPSVPQDRNSFRACLHENSYSCDCVTFMRNNISSERRLLINNFGKIIIEKKLLLEFNGME